MAVEILPENWGTVQHNRAGIDVFARLLTAVGCKVTRKTRRQYVFAKHRGVGVTKPRPGHGEGHVSGRTRKQMAVINA